MSSPDTGTTELRTRADETRDRLYRAAASAFAERGFYGTSTRDIAAAAGMSPAAVYVHHRSKEELLHHISRRGHQITLDLVRVAAGVFHTTNPRMTAAALLSLGIDIARWYTEGGEWSPEDVGEFYADLAL